MLFRSPCNDNNVCTTPDTCQAGVCVGTPVSGACTDHYMCYKIRPAAFLPILGVSLNDEFENITVDVRKVKILCPPASKNGEPVLDSVTHQEAYTFKGVSGTPKFGRRFGIHINDQFGPLVVDLLRRDLLLVPANKSLSGTPSAPDNDQIAVDHFKCYKVKISSGTPKFVPQTVGVTDQFIGNTAKSFVLKKVKHFCTPVDKNHEGRKNPAGYLTCYQAKPASGQPKHVRRVVNTNDQFGPLVLGTIKEAELCVPSVRTP